MKGHGAFNTGEDTGTKKYIKPMRAKLSKCHDTQKVASKCEIKTSLKKWD